MSNSLAAEPEIAQAFALYSECRDFQLFTVDIPKGSGSQQKIQKKIMPFPTGYGHLPWEGGMLDQPYRMMEWFEIFLNAERRSVFNKLK